jgi:hypothetical protein
MDNAQNIKIAKYVHHGVDRARNIWYSTVQKNPYNQ